MDYVEGETAITRCGHTYIHFTGINCYFKGDYSTVSVQYPGSSIFCSGSGTMGRTGDHLFLVSRAE